jgi:ParB family chromosome partitioning protein
MAIDPLSIATAAGISALSPVVAKGIGSLFGLDEPSEEEQRASRLRQEALDRLTAQAEGRTASPAQLAALAQQQRTQQALQSLAQRGTVQQRAGNVRAAMQAAPEVMAQQGAVAAQTRAAEMESARNALAQMQMASAAQEAAAGRANREYMQRLIGAGVSGGASAAAMGMMQGGDEAPKKPAATPAAAPTAAPAAAPTAAPVASRGVTSEQAARELGFTGGGSAPASTLSLGGNVNQAVRGGMQSATSALSLGMRKLGSALTPSAGSPVMQQSQQMDRLRAERRAAVPSPMSVGRSVLFGPSSTPSQARANTGRDSFGYMADHLNIANEFAPYMKGY